MGLLVLGILTFAGVHLVPSLAPALRGALMQRLGEGGYKGLFSLALLAGIGLIVFGWRSTLPSLVYLPPADLYPLALALMVLAFLLMVISGRPSRLKQILRHPQLTGVFLWGIAHLLVNGDRASTYFFGCFALLALAGMPLIDRKKEAQIGAAWGPFAMRTSALPFAAVVQGRTRIDWRGIGWWRPVLAVALYAIILGGHRHIFGVPPWPVF